jgi:quercetin dioxygenase-like cupin family protein
MRVFPKEHFPVPNFDELLETEGGICVRVTKLEKVGYMVPQHSHEFGHTTLIASGAVAFFLEGQYVKDLVAPAIQYVEPNKQHVYQALMDNSVLACISKQEK